MDAADEKLTALKKAYADIILSISKEAAARVLASEKKSMRYQHELKVVKEDGVRMLMRLKQMMDSQIIEAETASLNQHKKIEELEAQLQEAEDIVRDLREELGEVQSELERVKSENLKNQNDPCDDCSDEAPIVNAVSSYQSRQHFHPNESSDVVMPYLSLRNGCRKCYNKIGCTCGTNMRNQDLPSIIVRGKDPRLYRNGCTQRIHACERNLLDRDLCLLEETDKVKDKSNGGEQKEGKHTVEAPALQAKILSEFEKKLLADINLGSFKSFSRKRKRAVRQRKTVSLLGGKQSHSSPKLNQLCEHSVSSDPISFNANAHSDENPSKICPTLSQDKSELQIQLYSAKVSENGLDVVEIHGAKTMQEDEGESQKAVPLREVTGYSEGLLSPDCKMDVANVDVPSHGLESISTDTTERFTSQPVGERVIIYTFQRKRKRQALSGPEESGAHETKKQKSDGQNGDCRQWGSEVNGSCETEKKTGDAKNGDQKLEQLNPSLLKDSSRDLRQCRSEVNVSEKMEEKPGDEQNGNQNLEPPLTSLLKESSRDRRRLAQVARQLISLSEKKWWN